jgi:hypothetical protein
MRRKLSIFVLLVGVAIFMVCLVMGFVSSRMVATSSPVVQTNETTLSNSEPRPEDLPPVEITTRQLLLAFHNDFDAAKKEYPEGRRVVITGPLWQTHMPRVEDVQRAEMRMVQGKWSPLDGPPLPKAALWLGPAGVAPPGAPAILPATEMDADDELSRPGVIGEARQSSDENGNPAWFGQSLGYFYIWNFGESLTLNCRIYSAHRLPPEKTVEVLGVERTVKRLVDISIGLDDCVLMRRGSDEPTRTAVPDDVDKTAQESSSTTTSTNQTTPGSASQQQPAPSEPTSTKAPDITFQSTDRQQFKLRRYQHRPAELQLVRPNSKLLGYWERRHL